MYDNYQRYGIAIFLKNTLLFPKKIICAVSMMMTGYAVNHYSNIFPALKE